jgi:hypothetical protein
MRRSVPSPDRVGLLFDFAFVHARAVEACDALQAIADSEELPAEHRGALVRAQLHASFLALGLQKLIAHLDEEACNAT